MLTSPGQFILNQDISLIPYPDILVSPCDYTELQNFLPEFLDTIEGNVVGLAELSGTRKNMTHLAISSMSQVLVVHFSWGGKMRDKIANLEPLREFLLNEDISKSAFHMDRIAASLWIDHELCIVNAKDLFSMTNAHRGSLNALKTVLGGTSSLRLDGVENLFDNMAGSYGLKEAAMEAWAGCYSSVKKASELFAQTPINTLATGKAYLRVITKVVRTTALLQTQRPNRMKHEVEVELSGKMEDVLLISQRYRTKIRRTHGNQYFEITTSKGDNEDTQTHKGRLKEITGRAALVTFDKPVTDLVRSVETVGADLPGSVDNMKSLIVIEAMRNPMLVRYNPFLKTVCFNSKHSKWFKTATLKYPREVYFPSDRELNESQSKAVERILSHKDKHRVTLVHGPPGTGKTTVIAAAVTSIMLQPTKKFQHTVWLVAQSNVAVKNMAEKLASVNFLDFKIIVAKEFHFDWHEHLYEKLAENVITSDIIPDDLMALERILGGSKVILCTLSMLSNERTAMIPSLVPVQTIIFDEASQIDTYDYLPALVRFRPTMQKAIFVGDDKQLPPYGTSPLIELESVFDKGHLRDVTVFLDTQYRMPVPLGDFISKEVYGGLLKTDHRITDPYSCRFVDVFQGAEQAKGSSWMNPCEVDTVLNIARKFVAHRMSFRIITPYDPQRSLIEKRLKQSNLPWEDKCFNIDSFQGNEDDYIIVSFVRTEKLGFLNDARRVNVMLTRCKKGMVICTNRAFITGPASESLIGSLHASLPKNSAWIRPAELLNPAFDLFTAPAIQISSSDL